MQFQHIVKPRSQPVVFIKIPCTPETTQVEMDNPIMGIVYHELYDAGAQRSKGGVFTCTFVMINGRNYSDG